MELTDRDTHRNSPGHSNEALRVRGYTENTPWPAQNLLARRADPRLRPDAGLLYGKSAAQGGQSVVNVQPLDIAITRPVNWTTGSETSVQPSSTAQQSTVTPGLFSVLIVTSHFWQYTVDNTKISYCFFMVPC